MYFPLEKVDSIAMLVYREKGGPLQYLIQKFHQRGSFSPQRNPKSKRLGGDLLIEFVLGPARSTDSQWVPVKIKKRIPLHRK